MEHDNLQALLILAEMEKYTFTTHETLITWHEYEVAVYETAFTDIRSQFEGNIHQTGILTFYYWDANNHIYSLLQTNDGVVELVFDSLVHWTSYPVSCSTANIARLTLQVLTY